MTDLSRDPIVNVVHNGIKRCIRVLLEQECYRGALILVYSGIDTMAYLGMPASQTEVSSRDFIAWADKYISFPCKEQVTGEEFYGARCGMLHTYTPYSRSSRSGGRILGYMDVSVPEVRPHPEKPRTLVLVSISALVEAFLDGVDTFLVDLYADKDRAKVADGRFQKSFHLLPAKKK